MADQVTHIQFDTSVVCKIELNAVMDGNYNLQFLQNWGFTLSNKIFNSQVSFAFSIPPILLFIRIHILRYMLIIQWNDHTVPSPVDSI